MDIYIYFFFSAGCPLSVEDSWGQYYQTGDHPLSAATTAILNVHDDQSHGANVSSYEGYSVKPSQMPQQNSLGPLPPSAATATATLPEIWR